MGAFFVAAVAGTIYSAMKRLFKLDKVTGGASVELWVVITALLLVVWFLMESSGARVYSSGFTTGTAQVLSLLNYSMVHYTIGQMQLSAVRVNDYFQVWAVLLATLQCSVKVGRPYSRSKQMPLLDIMSSLWAANLLRVQTTSDLKIPLWLIWALNAARVVSFFFSSDKAEAGNQGNTRLVADYMKYEHTLTLTLHLQGGAGDGNGGDAPAMREYNYLVEGEDDVSREILQEERKVGSGSYRVELNPRRHRDLITIQKIWCVAGESSGLLGKTGDAKNRLKDVCLSFALHKLLRRRFYDLPLHEATVVAARDKARRLVFDYILEKTTEDYDYDYERAFRVTEVELAFLRDTFYSRHAATFAGGFPLLRMVLSLSLILAMGYIAYPVRHIPQRIDPNDKNHIVHGVFVTRMLIALIVAKELWEIYIYVFAPWTKVQMICMYVKHQRLRWPLAEKFWKVLLWSMPSSRWNRRIRQYNLLISDRSILRNTSTVKLRAEVQKAIFDSFKLLQQDDHRLENYLSNAFGSDQRLCSNLERTSQLLEADTHMILLWHIATAICEIKLTDDARQRQVYWMRSKPLINESKLDKGLWADYITAVSISNYCAYLVTERMVPENGLVAKRVFNEVRRETRRAVFYHDRHVSLQTIYDKLENIAAAKDRTSGPDGEAHVEENQQQDGAADIAAQEQVFQSDGVIDQDPEEGNNGNDDFRVVDDEPHNQQPNDGKPNGDKDGFDNTIIKMASEFGVQLIEAYSTDEDQKGLWRDLAKFWTGFLLHLAASTRAAKHKTHLPRNGELMTHLWALLSHAGYVGKVRHGHQALDQEDLNDMDPLS